MLLRCGMHALDWPSFVGATAAAAVAATAAVAAVLRQLKYV
jgi:hypothetical protein